MRLRAAYRSTDTLRGNARDRIIVRYSAHIRPACVEDFAAIYSINSECLPAVALLAAGDLDKLVSSAAVAWVAVADQAVVGYLLAYAPGANYEGEEFGWFRSRGDQFLYVDQIAVALAHRRRGVGAALYDAIEAFAGRERLASIACEVNVQPPNPGSMSFHVGRGFVEAGGIQTRDGRRVALLEKQLPKHA